jgi:hypothetical protein
MSYKAYCVLIRRKTDTEKLIELVAALTEPDVNIGWLSEFIRKTKSMPRRSGKDRRYGESGARAVRKIWNF